MAGEPLQAARVDWRGLAGDRRHALVEEAGKRAGKRLTARQAQRLLAWQAAYPDHPDDALGPDEVPPATVTGPDGSTWRWDQGGMAAALTDDLERPVSLVRTDRHTQQDLPDSMLVTFEASHRGVEEALGAAVDLRRYRTNLHVATDAPPFAEEGWEGATLVAGDLRLRLLHPCARCVIPTLQPDGPGRWPELLRWTVQQRGGLFGINARVEGPATVRVGEPVTVLPR